MPANNRDHHQRQQRHDRARTDPGIRDTVDRDGSRPLDALGAASARRTTDTLRDLDARVELNWLNPHRGADGWLHTQALIPGRQGAP